MWVRGGWAAVAALLGVTVTSLAGAARGAALPPPPELPEAPAWVITPEDAVCRTDLELRSHAGAVTPVSLLSDGAHVILRFPMEAVADRAFLPLRIDQKPFANLVLRGESPGLASMTLSDETLAALKRGKTLQIAWLSDEAVRAPLGGAAQGISDLKTCGAQVAARDIARRQAAEQARLAAEADARAKAVAEAQLAALTAQREAAEAEGRAKAAEAQRAAAEAERLTAQAAQDRAYAEEARQRAAADAYYQARQPRSGYYPQTEAPDDGPPPAWGYPRPYPQ